MLGCETGRHPGSCTARAEFRSRQDHDDSTVRKLRNQRLSSVAILGCMHGVQRLSAVAVGVLLASCSFSPNPARGDSSVEAGADNLEAGAGNPEAGAGNPEAGASCTAGVACDDLNPCTELDACFNGTCQGIDDLCPAMCSTICDATCGGDTCCTQTCPGGTCPSCPAGCSCDLSCGQDRPCTATCLAGAHCRIVGTNNETDGAYNVTCQAGSQCVVDCVGNEGPGCTVTCAAGASCLVIDNMNPAPTTLDCQPTGPAPSCPAPNAKVKVCNRPCP